MPVILMHVFGVPEQPQCVVTLKPRKVLLPWPQSWVTLLQTTVIDGRHRAVAPPPSSAWAARDRIIGGPQVMAPAAAAFVRKSRRFIDDRNACSTMSGDSFMSFISSTSALVLEECRGSNRSNGVGRVGESPCRQADGAEARRRRARIRRPAPRARAAR